MKKIGAVLRRFNQVLEILMFIAMAIMVVVMFGQVFFRYVFSTGVAWSEELSRFTMIFMIFAGGVVLTADKEHISVTVFDEMLKGTALKVLKTIQNVIMIIYSAVVARFGWDSLAVVSSQKSPNLRVSMDKIYIIIPICCIFMIVYLIFNTVALYAGDEGDGKEVNR